MPSRRRADVGFGVTDLAACRAEALSKTYGRRDTAVHALREITLSIPPHAFTAIMGPSGSGKSTLLHCLAALDTPTSGRVFLGQTELTSLSRRQQAQVRRDRIGFVFQAFNLVPTLDAIENITLPQLLAGRRPNKEWLEYVVAQIGLRDRLHHRPSQLSGGQQQRVALARALAGRPEVIFADEPTGNLDTKASREMLSLLRSAVDDFRQTVVTVTHDPAIAGYADQVLFFTDGQVVDQVLHPEQDLVLEHLQYLDSSTPAYRGPRRQLRASMQQDGQHIMRSRRRRRADETVPGRPMVGDDDEVEVARQERWLQRIREQFDAEHDTTHASNGYHAGDASADTGDGYPHTTGNGFAATPSQHTGNGHHSEPAYDTHNGYAADGYAPTVTNGYDAPPAHTTGNGFHDAPPAHTTGNGFHAPADHTGNGFDPEPAYESQNGHTNTRHIAPDTYQTAHTGNGYDTGDGYHTASGYSPEAAYDSRNGHAADTGDEGWLPAERSWLSDTGGTASMQDAGTSQQNGQWAQATPIADEYPVQQTPEPVPDSQTWQSDSWDTSEQTQRWLPPASADVAPAAPQPPARPARSWREDSGQEPSDDVWSAPSTTSDSGWATIPPPASSPPVSSTGQWDTSQPPEQNGWSSQPLTRYEPADPPARNGHGTDTGWKRWEPDPYVTHGNGADPVLGAQRNGYHGADRNGHAPPASGDESYAHSNGTPLEAAPAQSNGNGATHLHSRDAGPHEQASSDGWLAPVDNRSDERDDTPERIEDPVRELLDIWSPKAAADDGPQQDSVPAADAAPSDIAPYSSNSTEPAASGEGDQGQGAGAWGPAERNGHHTGAWEPADQNGHHTGAWEPADQNGHHTGAWEPADQWQVDYMPGANHEPHELPPAHLAPPSPSSSTTDPFEALHSLQSQLNRLGGGRRAPRRYED